MSGMDYDKIQETLWLANGVKAKLMAELDNKFDVTIRIGPFREMEFHFTHVTSHRTTSIKINSLALLKYELKAAIERIKDEQTCNGS